MRSSNNILGRVHSIDTYSTLDGFGIRSVVFMQGCDLRCIYCHNPDTWNKCNGTEMSVKDIVTKLHNYIDYYGNNGGVTFGGGEPLLQASFVNACVKEFAKLNVKCAIETSGNVELNQDIKDLVTKLDFVICDLKFSNAEDYKKYANADMGKTLKFVRFLEANNIPLWIRTVVVPGINDNEKALIRYQDIVKGLSNVIRWELLPLSKLGFGKYESLGIVNRLIDVEDLDMTKFKQLQEKFEIKNSKR